MIKCIVIKLLIIILIVLIIIKYFNNKFDLNKYIFNYQKELSITFPFKIRNKIRLGIYTFCMKNGGRARIATMLINFLYKFKLFNIYLYTQKNKENAEYKYPQIIKRIVINNNNITKIFKNNIDILIFHLNGYKAIKTFNNYNKIKVIYYIHNSIFKFLYLNDTYFRLLYKEYTKSNYIISLISFENDFLFKKWGINSILMDSFITYNYKRIIPSDVSSKIILMIGRGNDKNKRFEIGIRSVEYIALVIRNFELKIISEIYDFKYLINLIDNLNLINNIKIEGFKEFSDIFFKNASLHFFPSNSESFGLVLCETKIYGIPNILLGIDYISIARNGTIIIYDDSPESLAKEALYILSNNKYREYLGKEARRNMEKYNNEILTQKWIKLIIYIFKDDSYYQKLNKQQKKITDKEGLLILNRQNHILKNRHKDYIINYKSNTFINY